jgi:hypothetical protein
MPMPRYQIIKVVPITHKMKNRVREHGEIWMVERKDGNEYQITPVNPANHEFPYSTRIVDGVDVKIERIR